MEGMKQYPDKHFDLAVVDIPYGLNVAKMPYTRDVSHSVKQKNGTRMQISKRKPYAQKDWDIEVPTQEYFDELKRVSHDQIIFGIEYTNWKGVGNGRIRWDKCMPDGVSFNRYETAYCSLINITTEIKLLWAGMQQAKSISEPTTAQGNKKLNEKRIHPCHKPVMLYQILLSKYAHTGAKIIDTHLGGGSIRIAAHSLDMELTAFEIDRDYFEAQEERFRLYKSQLKLAI